MKEELESSITQLGNIREILLSRFCHKVDGILGHKDKKEELEKNKQYEKLTKIVRDYVYLVNW